MQEFGAMAYHPRSPEVEGSDLAFPNNEHHLPISSFATEQGMTQKNASTTSNTSLLNPLRFRRKSKFKVSIGGNGKKRKTGSRCGRSSEDRECSLL